MGSSFLDLGGWEVSITKEGKGEEVLIKKVKSGTSLVVHWLRLCASNAGSVGLVPSRGINIPHSAALPKKKKKIEVRSKAICSNPVWSYFSYVGLKCVCACSVMSDFVWSVQASHHSDLSCCRACALGHKGFNSCGTWAQQWWPLGSRLQTL